MRLMLRASRTDVARVAWLHRYMHRIGRSGRFGVKGAAFNLVCGGKEQEVLVKISRHFDRQIDDVAHDNDDSFELVLQQAGLMSRD
jgi:ATP-dependent RNA helicase DDX19/DBP5